MDFERLNTSMTKAIAMFSGGVASWVAAKRASQKYGVANTTLLFADTKGEDEDLYRFLEEGAANIGAPLVRIAEGRTIWEVFRAERFLGNARIDPCSKILKREVLDAWVEANCDPLETVIVHGFDWSEGHRFQRMLSYGGKWQREAPLLEPPYLNKAGLIALCRAEGLEPPRLYAMGFQHNNCGGGCVKAGQAAFAQLLRVMPERYREWEENEEAIRAHLGKDVSILTDRTNAERHPLTLREFRERKQAGGQHDLMDWGACGCFSAPPVA